MTRYTDPKAVHSSSHTSLFLKFDRNHLQYVKEVHEDASKGVECFTERNSPQAGNDKISND